MTHRKDRQHNKIHSGFSVCSKASSIEKQHKDLRLYIELTRAEAGGRGFLVVRFKDMASFGRAVGTVRRPDRRQSSRSRVSRFDDGRRSLAGFDLWAAALSPFLSVFGSDVRSLLRTQAPRRDVAGPVWFQFRAAALS